jgi:hypothetical protein
MKSDKIIKFKSTSENYAKSGYEAYYKSRLNKEHLKNYFSLYNWKLKSFKRIWGKEL